MANHSEPPLIANEYHITCRVLQFKNVTVLNCGMCSWIFMNSTTAWQKYAPCCFQTNKLTKIHVSTRHPEQKNCALLLWCLIKRSKSIPVFLQQLQYSDTENEWALTALHSVLGSLGTTNTLCFKQYMVPFYVNILYLSHVQTTGIKEERITEFFIFPAVGLTRLFWSYLKLLSPSYPRSLQWTTGPSSYTSYSFLLPI